MSMQSYESLTLEEKRESCRKRLAAPPLDPGERALIACGLSIGGWALFRATGPAERTMLERIQSKMDHAMEKARRVELYRERIAAMGLAGLDWIDYDGVPMEYEPMAYPV